MDDHLPFLLNTILDTMLLIALVVVAVLVGKPLSYLDCQAIDKVADDASSALAFTAALGSSLKSTFTTATGSERPRQLVWK